MERCRWQNRFGIGAQTYREIRNLPAQYGHNKYVGTHVRASAQGEWQANTRGY